MVPAAMTVRTFLGEAGAGAPRLRYHAYSSLDFLPPSGVVVTFRVTEAHDPRLPAPGFASDHAKWRLSKRGILHS